jgi:putative glycosyltransferase (TIGR04348 family)
MRIVIATPVRVGSTRGNGVTARRWQRVLSELGHEARVLTAAEVGGDCDLLVALHARKSASVIEVFARTHPTRPIVLAMTGTDLYGDLPGNAEALASVRAADRIVVLQPAGIERLPEDARDRCVVIRQSIEASPVDGEPPTETFAICVLAHLREVKDPFLAANAAALLPDSSRVHVTLAGAATDAEWEARARREQEDSARFTWLGELPAAAAARLLQSSHVLVVSSLLEGGANVVTEAIVAGVPILASDIDGNRGLLGAEYRGYYPVGDAPALASLMKRAESESAFRAELCASLDRLRPLFDPAREREAWSALLADLETAGS